MTLRAPRTVATLAALAALGLTACGSDAEEPAGSDATGADGTDGASEDAAASAPAEGDGTVTLYSGRNEDLVQPVLDAFTDETGIEVEVRYADTAAMAAQILEEGDNSPAEAFLAQDAGALGAVAKEGRLLELPQETLDLVPETYRSQDGDWVGLTGRARVLVYNKDAVAEDELPSSVQELTEDEWAGRVGIAPTNASFQSFVTAMRVQEGDDTARQWLTDMAANDGENVAEEAGDDVVAAADSAGNAVEEGADEVAQAAENTGEAVEDGAENVAESAGDMADEAEQEMAEAGDGSSGLGGIIAVGADGTVAMPFSYDGMVRGYATHTDEPVAGVFEEME